MVHRQLLGHDGGVRPNPGAPSLTPLLACGLLCLAGCSGGRSTEHSLFSDAPGTFVRAGAPHPYACVTDADCQPGPAVNPDNGCCDTGVHLRVFNRAYLAWRASWVAQHCAAIRCPAIPSPSRPLPCSLEGRCQRSRCISRCGEAAVAPTTRSAATASVDARPRVVEARPGPISGRGFDGTILPPDTDGFLPTPAEILALESQLPAYILQASKRNTVSSQVPQRLHQYKRQYSGEIASGRRRIHVNLLCRVRGSEWRRYPVGVRGGGECYLRTTYDLAAGRFVALNVNSPR